LAVARMATRLREQRRHGGVLQASGFHSCRANLSVASRPGWFQAQVLRKVLDPPIFILLPVLEDANPPGEVEALPPQDNGMRNEGRAAEQLEQSEWLGLLEQSEDREQNELLAQDEGLGQNQGRRPNEKCRR
jgi:hypothetical protein